MSIRNETIIINYRKVTNSNTSRLEAHAGFFRLVMTDLIFDPYVLWPFDIKVISQVRTPNYTVCRSILGAGTAFRI